MTQNFGSSPTTNSRLNYIEESNRVLRDAKAWLLPGEHHSSVTVIDESGGRFWSWVHVGGLNRVHHQITIIDPLNYGGITADNFDSAGMLRRVVYLEYSYALHWELSDIYYRMPGKEDSSDDSYDYEVHGADGADYLVVPAVNTFKGGFYSGSTGSAALPASYRLQNIDGDHEFTWWVDTDGKLVLDYMRNGGAVDGYYYAAIEYMIDCSPRIY